MRVAVIGSTGYVGGRLVPALLEAGHQVRCLARTPARLDGVEWRSNVEVMAADVLEQGSLDEPLRDIDAVYYLVHAMGQDGDFEESDRSALRTPASLPKGRASQGLCISEG